MKQAFFFEYDQKKNTVTCELCPVKCLFDKEDKIGNCRVYVRKNNKLWSTTYGKISAAALDPVEKKPLYHFNPGKKIFSVGSFGCNMHCSFCQNWVISQQGAVEHDEIPPTELVKKALEINNNIGIAYTYNEPFVWYEYVYDTASVAFDKGLKNVVVSNGMINEKPLKKLIPFIHAFNIDLKAFSQDFYKKNCSGNLECVKNTIKTIFVSGKHIEITNLVIPELNDNLDDFEKMCKWISEMSADIPLHISRYFPNYKMSKERTSVELVEKLKNIAKNYLNYVYLGNV